MIYFILLAILISASQNAVIPSPQHPPPQPQPPHLHQQQQQQQEQQPQQQQLQAPLPLDPILQLANFTRSYDGSLNNDANPNWGAAGQPMPRIAPAAYADGLGAPITNGKPNVRNISNILCQAPDEAIDDITNRSMLVVLLGQFINHDLDLVPTQTNGQTMPISVPRCDINFDSACTGTVTLPFSRSKFVNGTTSPRNHINDVSGFLDLSTVYGSNLSTAQKLRSFSKGKLKTSGIDMLPTQVVNGFTQYLAGDQRVNQNIGLTTMHTIFMREHNNICDRIIAANSSLADQIVFQTARNYLIGLYQKIVYQEYLPNILGVKMAPYSYNSSINPTPTTQFLTAAFRFGHPTIYDEYSLRDQNNQIIENLTLSQMFFNPSRVNETSLDQILRGSMATPAKQRDLTAVDDIRNLLILGPGSTIKLDLISMNIQRGRDHGIPDYNTLNQAMNLPTQNFNQLNFVQASKLKSLYTDSSNIDAFIGMLADPVGFLGGMMGHLAWNIIQQQFIRLRDGDKFFWQSSVYPRKIKDQFRNTTFADLITRNTGITTFPSNIFQVMH